MYDFINVSWNPQTSFFLFPGRPQAATAYLENPPFLKRDRKKDQGNIDVNDFD